TWLIPADAAKPGRRKLKQPETLLEILRDQKKNGQHGGIYHKLQIELTYNSNHIEGSRLTHDQTMYIFETNTIGFENETVNVDDIVETVNHFRCIDYVIENAEKPLTESFIKALHKMLKTGTSDSRKEWFEVGNYKRFANEVGGRITSAPEEVPVKMKELLTDYSKKTNVTIDDIIDFHYRFESIHPFQDGNGRVGRLIMLKECLRYKIVPFIITDDLKMFYYRGLKNWKQEKGWLTDTILTAQDRFKAYLDYFRIKHD
ncbi:MAG: Fic family protein, partial [Oscillospiraceae bacterium]|nr:Fic family protein [Oscillospiraceae bacterium]